MTSFLMSLPRRGRMIAWSLLALATLAGSVSGSPRPQPAAAEPSAYPAGAPPAVTVIRSAVAARIDGKRRISGVATIHAVASSEVREVALSLDPGLELSGARLRLADADPWEPVALGGGASTGEDLRLPLPRTLPAGARFVLELDYHGLPPWLALGDGLYVTVPGRSWYPRLGEAPATFELEAPSGIEVAVAGEPGIAPTGDAGSPDGASRSRFLDITPGLILVPAKASRQDFQAAGLRVRLRRARAAAARDTFSVTESTSVAARPAVFRSPLPYLTLVALAGFQGSFGPLPWQQVEVVQAGKFRPGVSWPGLVVLPSYEWSAPEGALHSRLSEETYFELARQWWGHAVRPGREEDRWLLEGLAEHAVALAVEQHRGRAAAVELRQRARDRVLAEAPPRASLAAPWADVASGGREGGGGPAWRALKGAFVLEGLRALLRRPGSAEPDAAWFGALRELASTYAGASPTTDDFQRLVERHLASVEGSANEGRLGWYFDQWVRGSKVPALASSLTAQKADGDRYRITGSVALAGVSETFRALVPLHADLGRSGAANIGHIQLVGTTPGAVDLTVTLPAKPKRVVANLHHELLTRDP